MTAPRIVVLDGFTLNPGDLSWAPLGALGRLTVFERSTPRELLSRAAGAELLITNKAVIDRGAIEALPELRYIGVTATGTNVVDREAARARGVVVSNVPSYGAEDRKSTRLNSSHSQISYAVFCLKKKRVHR